uniref:G protein-coupled receptor 137B n=1 Tax=Callithrix jacchus TaxID=9483 RepID=A0A8I4A0T5_CALJA
MKIESRLVVTRGPEGERPRPMETPPSDPASNYSLPPTLTPAVLLYVKLSLTVVYTVFYTLLFVFIYVPLWLVLVFLFLCLFWASLQTVLVSYFKDLVEAKSLSPLVFWLLCCFPVCLQFFTLTLMNLYFMQVIFKAKSKYSPELLKYRLPLYLASLFISLIFLLVNLTLAINDTLFMLCAVSLSICLYKISKMSLANIYLESQGSSECQVTAIGVTVILLYTSWACYNLFILSFSQNKSIHSFDYDWYNVSDQAELKNQLGDAGYVLFGVVLFVWELLPTTLVVYFFRVRNPTKDLTNPGIVPSHGFSPRSYFFDNPRRYDSDDDLAWNIAPQGLQGGFSPDFYDWGQETNSFLAQAGTLQDSALDPDKPSLG